MDNNKVVCGCFNVTVQDLKNAIKNGAKSFKEVQAVTKVGTGCGHCTGSVKALVSEMENNLSVNNKNLAKVMKEQEYSRALEHVLEFLSVPEGYVLKNVQRQKQNEEDIWIFRYEKSSGKNNGLGGEHFSFAVEKINNKVLGFTLMDQNLSAGELPSKEETKAIAKAFLDNVEPGMFEKLENLWIDRHDEIITLKDEKNNESVNITISGMKYKCYLKEKDNYAWVIVGSGGKVITFEQGIIWDSGRVTEKWLHDSWLKNK